MKPAAKKIVISLLQTLKELKPNHRVILLSHLDDKSTDALFDSIRRVLRASSLPLSTRQRLRRVLSPHKESVRFIADSRNSRVARKKKMVQMGGFPIAALLGAAVPLIVDLIAKHI